MKLELTRIYSPEGTNGILSLNNSMICYTIELPWKDNQHGISCIPEGEYELTLRYSQKFGVHLQVMNVPKRDLILIHPANDAIKELKGCIAPVLVIIGHGKGLHSRIALSKLKKLLYPAFEKDEHVYLSIQNNH